jgi:hypothetical protein
MSFGNDCGTKPVDPVEAALWFFANTSNWTAFHPEDDNKFYEFVVAAFQDKRKWQREDVEELLRKFGLPERLIKPLGERYWAGRCALVKKSNIDVGNDDTVF